MTQRDIFVHLLPELTTSAELAGATVVVIDVLRATTSMVFAMAGGAAAIYPCLTIDEARQLAGNLAGPVLLGGERHGVPIDGFDLGNSPSEYMSQRVQGASIVMTTTNGTKALGRCLLAKRVLVAGFVNLDAVVDALMEETELHIVCAGTDGAVTREDVLLAGALVHQWATGATLEDCGSEVDDVSDRSNDAARLALAAWRDAQGRGGSGGSSSGELERADWERELKRSQGGRNLMAIGALADIELAAQSNRFRVVPQFDCQTRRITLRA